MSLRPTLPFVALVICLGAFTAGVPAADDREGKAAARRDQKDKDADSTADKRDGQMPDILKSLELSDSQKQKIKNICGECDSERETAWKDFSKSYRQAIGIEASMLAAIEDHLSDNQRKHVREQRRRMAHGRQRRGQSKDSQAADAAKAQGERAQRPAAGRAADEVEEIVIVGVTLSPEQESAAEGVGRTYLDRLADLNEHIDDLHSRLIALETERLLKIEEVLTKEQREQLRKEHQKLAQPVTLSGAPEESQ